jgi:pilus assembly protein CpaB
VTYSVRNIAIAVVMAIAAAAAVLVYTTSYRQSVTNGQKHVDVMVATRDIPAGTPASDAVGALKLTSILSDDTTPGVLTTTAGLEGKVAAQPIYAGQQVVSAAFATSANGDLQLGLTGNERGVQMVCDPVASCLLEDVKAGDRVDVFATMKVKTKTGGDDVLVSRLLLPGVRVLKVPAVDPKAKKGLSGGATGNDKQTITLAVDQRDATKFTWAQGAGDPGAQLWIVARPPDAAAQDQPVVGETVTEMLTDGLSAAELAKLTAALKGN